MSKIFMQDSADMIHAPAVSVPVKYLRALWEASTVGSKPGLSRERERGGGERKKKVGQH